MTDFDRLQTRQGVLFKDAVLGLAEDKSLAIIAQAGEKRANELEEAYKQTAGADYCSVKERYVKENEKEFMAVATAARRELLQERGALVEELFEAVEEKLAAFTKTSAYASFLTSLLQSGADDIGQPMQNGVAGRITGFISGLLSRVVQEECDKEAITVHLRPQDNQYIEALRANLPAARFVEDKSIRLGGLKVDDGHIMFDETLDRRLAEAKNRFFESGRMSVR